MIAVGEPVYVAKGLDAAGSGSVYKPIWNRGLRLLFESAKAALQTDASRTAL